MGKTNNLIFYSLNRVMDPRPKLSMFCAPSQNYLYFFKYINILKQFVWEIQSGIEILVDHGSGSWVIAQNVYLRMLTTFFSKNCWLFWVNAQSMLNFSLAGVQFSFKYSTINVFFNVQTPQLSVQMSLQNTRRLTRWQRIGTIIQQALFSN